MNVRQVVRKHFPIVMDGLHWIKKEYGYQVRKHCSLNHRIKIISKEYQSHIGCNLNIENPKRYTEKIQWVKLYGITDEMRLLSDKYRVRDWVKETIGEEYLLPLITSVKKFSDINFESLPNRFVIKSNNSSGWNIIVKDKKSLNLKNVKQKMNYWRKRNYAFHSIFEMQYEKIAPIFLIEDYVEDSNGELNDYKFLCFHGKPYYCWVDTGRFSHHTRTVYDMNWVRQPWSQIYNPEEVNIQKPKNFDEMLKLAEILCKGFPEVRVDLYNVDGKIYFGEMTFTNGNGLDPIVPDKYDEALGSLLKLPNKKMV